MQTDCNDLPAFDFTLGSTGCPAAAAAAATKPQPPSAAHASPRPLLHTAKQGGDSGAGGEEAELWKQRAALTDQSPRGQNHPH